MILYKERIAIVPLNTIAAMYEINQDGYSKEITYLPKNLKSKPHFNVLVTAYDYSNKEELIKRYDEIFSRMLIDGTIKKNTLSKRH